MKKSFSTKRIVIFPDIHFAHSVNGIKAQDRHDPKAVSVALQILNAVKPDMFIQLGDLGHFAYISHWNQNKDLFGKASSEDGESIQMTLREDTELINRFWDRIKAPEIVSMEGNHEQIVRVTRNMNKYAPLVNNDWYLEKAWRLKERGIRWVPYERYGEGSKNWVDVGPNLKVLHGQYVGKSALAQHYTHWDCNLIIGHLHWIAEQSFPSLNNHKMVKSIGCLATKYASYHRGRNNAWGQAISVVYLKPDGIFHENTIRVFNGEAVYNGKVYRAKKEGWME